ncbi:MAG: hypothetical protein ABJN26_08905 [Stappiaceae bacterium]
MENLSEDAARIAATYFSMGRVPMLVPRISAKFNEANKNALTELVERGYLRRQKFNEADLYIQIQDMSGFRKLILPLKD